MQTVGDSKIFFTRIICVVSLAVTIAFFHFSSIVRHRRHNYEWYQAMFLLISFYISNVWKYVKRRLKTTNFSARFFSLLFGANQNSFGVFSVMNSKVFFCVFLDLKSKESQSHPLNERRSNLFIESLKAQHKNPFQKSLHSYP